MSIMNAADWIAERGPACPACGGETRKDGAMTAGGGEQTDGLFTEVAWLCTRCGHGFEDAALARQNEALRASAYRLRTLARQLMRSSHVQRKS